MAAVAQRGAAGAAEVAGAAGAMEAEGAGAMQGAMPIEVLAEHGVSAADVRKLSEGGIHTVEGLAQRARRDLAQIKARAPRPAFPHPTPHPLPSPLLSLFPPSTEAPPPPPPSLRRPR